jgi:hypothetical protein
VRGRLRPKAALATALLLPLERLHDTLDRWSWKVSSGADRNWQLEDDVD